MERHKLGSLNPKTVSTTGITLIQASDRRVGLWIFAPKTNTVWVTDVTNPSLNSGFPIRPGTDPVYLDLENAGTWLQRELHAIAETASENIAVLEVIRP
jgi:hypothetical protein